MTRASTFFHCCKTIVTFLYGDGGGGGLDIFCVVLVGSALLLMYCILQAGVAATEDARLLLLGV